MQTMTMASALAARRFPPFSLLRLLQTVFQPKKGEKLCILIDLDHPKDVVDFAFLKKNDMEIQKKAYDVFYQGILHGIMQELGLRACDFFAYQKTGGSNLELPKSAIDPKGKVFQFKEDIYPVYQIILCISTFSATAPLTAAAKKFGFRGSTMHGVNNLILKTGLAVDYNEVSGFTEVLRQGMTGADRVDIDFRFQKNHYHLTIDLDRQEAQKSHGICRTPGDIVNLPAGEVYFVPSNAHGNFPMKFEDPDETVGCMEVDDGAVRNARLLKGSQEVLRAYNQLLASDPAAGILGELGFGTQVLPFSGSDIQDEKIFGTFHLATGRNDHLNGSVVLDSFKNPQHATHEDILFSSTKTPEIKVEHVRMLKHGKVSPLIENYEPCAFLWNLHHIPEES